LTNFTLLSNGAFQFGFSATAGTGFTAFGTTNLTLPFSNWPSLGAVAEMSPGQFQFTDVQASNNTQRFYRVTSP
jgi:hypothetical protein